MKNKKNIYILLPVVLLIWGLVIYRFFSFTAPEIQAVETSNQLEVKPLAIPQRDTLSIDVNYRDPFLGKMYMPLSNASKVIKRKSTPQEPIAWPQILYKGIVSDKSNKRKVFMVVINGKSYLMKEKETKQEMTLKSGNRESIIIKYKGDLTKIFIQE